LGWCPTRNETLTPAAVLPKSGRTVWWLCPAGHEWRTSVYARVSLRSGCPYCAGQRATDETSLAQRYPAVAGEWHPTRNGNRTPETTTFGSRIGVFWVCYSCGHEWRATPHSRTVRGTSCRECAWSTTRISRVPLTLTHPEIAAQWHPTRNEETTPDQITYGSGRRVWWHRYPWKAPLLPPRPRGEDHRYLYRARTAAARHCSLGYRSSGHCWWPSPLA